MKNRANREYGQVIMWAAIIVSAPRWAGAFIAADTAAIPPLVDGALQYLNMVSGFGMGLIEVLGTAYLLDAWARMKPRKTWNAKHLNQRWLILTGFVAGLFLLMPIILAPYMVARMNGTTVAAVAPAWFEYVWAVAAVLSPAFIIGGVAVARDGGLVARSQPAPAADVGLSAKNKPVGKPTPAAKQAEERFACPQCDRSFGSGQALNAHQRAHRKTAEVVTTE